MSQSKDPGWLTEAPLTTVTTKTTPVLIATLSTGIIEDAHSEHDEHPVPVFRHPYYLVNIELNAA